MGRFWSAEAWLGVIKEQAAFVWVAVVTKTLGTFSGHCAVNWPARF